MASSPRTGRSSIAITAFLVGLAIVVLCVVAFLAGSGDILAGPGKMFASFFPPVAVTDRGEHIRQLYQIVFVIATVIFFIVEGLIVWSVVRYRRRPGDDVLPVQTHGNAIAEIVWTVVPTLIVAFMFVISWQTLNTVEASTPTPDIKIRAVAGQFQWSFDYLPSDFDPVKNRAKPLFTQFLAHEQAPGDGSGMFVPAGKTIQLYLESPDVIHAFYVPQFLFKRDVVPGRINTFQFTVDAGDAGQTFRGQCAELCGAGHRIMLFEVHALAPADYDAWLQKQIKSAAPAPSGQPAGSGQPPASGQPAPGGGAPGPTLAIAAQNVSFDVSSLTTKADTPFKIAFDNKDTGTPHNVAIHKDSPTGQEVFKGEIFPGPGQRTYDVPALPAGTYAFACSVHPNMTGTLTVN